MPAPLGTFNRRIRIEQRRTTQEARFGTRVDTWVAVVTLWANIEELTAAKAEEVAGGIRIALRPTRVRTPYVSGLAEITSDMRVIYLDRGSRVMKITSPPVEIGSKDGLEFMVAEFSSTGAAS